MTSQRSRVLQELQTHFLISDFLNAQKMFTKELANPLGLTKWIRYANLGEFDLLEISLQ